MAEGSEQVLKLVTRQAPAARLVLRLEKRLAAVLEQAPKLEQPLLLVVW